MVGENWGKGEAAITRPVNTAALRENDVPLRHPGHAPPARARISWKTRGFCGDGRMSSFACRGLRYSVVTLAINLRN